ncbi:MAG: EAL domain-containing protein [Desulfovibrio sp.]|nr:EAL domain-containing protein [Desulfovibrio sp.]
MRVKPFYCLAICILALFAALTYVANYSIVMSGVDTIESRHMYESMHQLQNYLRFTELQMHQRVVDWACWDEAYEYVITRDEQFINSNFDELFLQSQHISFVAFFYNDKTPFRFLDNQQIYDDAFFLAKKDASIRLAEQLSRRDSDAVFGIINIQNSMFVVAAHRIYDGNKLKPPRGILVMARSLDESFVAEAEKMIRLQFSIVPKERFDNLAFEKDDTHSFKIVKEKHFFRVYSLCNDLFGNPAYCLELVTDRDISKMGQSMSLKNCILMIGLGLALLLIGLCALHQKEKLIMKRELAYRIGHDSLTGLANKNLIDEQLEDLMHHAGQYGKEAGVFFIDLSRFKNVNDSYGHEVGDRLLQESAQRLRSVYPGAVLARTGGDEFVLGVEYAKKDLLPLLAKQVINSLADPFYVNEHNIHLGANVGIAVFPCDGKNAQVLMHRAELAMYAAKLAHQEGFLFFAEQMGQIAAQRMVLEAALYKVVEENGLTVFYQPKVDCVKKKVVGLEALVRWQKTDGSWVAPPAFIPLAEETGLVTRIDMFVLRTVCRQVKAWEKDKIAVRVSVNMSAKSILSANFSEQVNAILQEEGTSPGSIGVEVTETCLVTHLDMASKAISILSHEGIEVSLDDFGTGYSSLLYLHALPISCLKIDKKFIDDIDAPDGSSNSLVKGILALAAGLGMSTVAEGVENREQLNFLRQNDCSVIQGYYYSKPLNAHDCEDFLLHQKERIAAVEEGKA